MPFLILRYASLPTDLSNSLRGGRNNSLRRRDRGFLQEHIVHQGTLGFDQALSTFQADANISESQVGGNNCLNLLANFRFRWTKEDQWGWVWMTWMSNWRGRAMCANLWRNNWKIIHVTRDVPTILDTISFNPGITTEEPNLKRSAFVLPSEWVASKIYLNWSEVRRR